MKSMLGIIALSALLTMSAFLSGCLREERSTSRLSR